jgi:hypothetical protein
MMMLNMTKMTIKTTTLTKTTAVAMMTPKTITLENILVNLMSLCFWWYFYNYYLYCKQI